MATDSPVYNRLQSVFYRLPFMYDLWATATATDRNSGQPDRKSGCLRSIFRSGPVQFPVYMTGLSNTSTTGCPSTASCIPASSIPAHQGPPYTLDGPFPSKYTHFIQGTSHIAADFDGAGRTQKAPLANQLASKFGYYSGRTTSV